MGTRYQDVIEFNNTISLVNLATSGVGASVAPGNWGWSISNQSTLVHSLDATASSAATVANALATLIYDLQRLGFIRASGLLG
jgi:hypothetical protein